MRKYVARLCFTLLVILFVSYCTKAQNRSEKDLVAAVSGLVQALKSADTITLHELAMDKLSYGHSSGKIQQKNELINSLTDGSSVFVDIRIPQQTVIVSGKTAIVRQEFHAETFDNNKKGHVDLNILLVWQKINKKWKLLARQAVKI